MGFYDVRMFVCDWCGKREPGIRDCEGLMDPPGGWQHAVIESDEDRNDFYFCSSRCECGASRTEGQYKSLVTDADDPTKGTTYTLFESDKRLPPCFPESDLLLPDTEEKMAEMEDQFPPDGEEESN